MERPMTPNAKPFPNSLAGRLLLAMPGMPDPRFQHSVLAMCVHDADGALGIGIGEELGLTLHALLDDLDIPRGVAPDVPVLSGGPVERHRGFVLHSPDWPRADSTNREGTLAVGPHWSLTGSRDVLRAIAEGTGPAHWLVALGYAGWGAGQLDGEMREHGWYAAEGRAGVLFDTHTQARWAATWRAEGIDPALLAKTTGHA